MMNQAEMALTFALIMILPFVLRTAYRAYLSRWGDAEGRMDWNIGDQIGFTILGLVLAVLAGVVLTLS